MLVVVKSTLSHLLQVCHQCMASVPDNDGQLVHSIDRHIFHDIESILAHATSQRVALSPTKLPVGHGYIMHVSIII